MRPIDWILPILCIGVAACVFAFFDPYPQPDNYYDFADQRPIAGVAHFWNVVSNAAFLWPGIAGFIFTLSADETNLDGELRIVYLTMFAGVILTAFGSAWFHLSPSTETLVWDRLPMTLVFMAFFAAVLAEFVSLPLGRKLFAPLLISGIGSVVYWAWSESQGQGDLRAYALVQFLPMILIPAIALLHDSRFDKPGYIFWVYGFYALAKIAEQLDDEIYAIGNAMSGHAIKHVLAAAAALALYHGVKSRHRIETGMPVA